MRKNCKTCAVAKRCNKLTKKTGENVEEIICADFVSKTGQKWFIATIITVGVVVILGVLTLVLWYIYARRYF